ncbi:phosphotransferase [Halosimplex litoreum]|uniref:Phosphotransferase n=1 Tax=Halosimplex litoreum TaxID=1198301 RepID=A0A7T3G161_9EURY|nr:phosphotransferase [Halosimplex litoreum]QPV64382.1 phosphotransferase [Halosimplex litoreum]
MDERFATALGDAFPDREIAGFADDDPQLNERNGTVPVEFADGERVFCKIAVDGDGGRLDAERAVIEYVDADCDVPVPTVLACDPDAEVPYLVTAPMDGRPLANVKYEADRAGEAAAMRALGRSLAELHDRRFDAHGEITGGGTDGLAVDEKPWIDVFLGGIETIREMAHSERFERYVDDVVAAVEANRETLDAAPATLVHNDPHSANAYRSEAGVGLLDWEFARVGDPARGLHRVREQEFGLFRPDEPDHQLDALREGYRERAGDLPDGYRDRVPIYEAVRLLGASAFFEEKAESADEPPREVAEWMDAEMERRLDAIQ